MVRVALANIARASSPDDSVTRTLAAIEEAGRTRADILCFPEAYVPGYRLMGRTVPPADAMFLRRAPTSPSSSVRSASSMKA